jgi:hypothetical protein
MATAIGSWASADTGNLGESVASSDLSWCTAGAFGK